VENVLQVVAALIISDEKVLLVYEDGLLHLPQGTQQIGETSLACLKRVLREKIPDSAIVGRPTHWRLFKDIVALGSSSVAMSVCRTQIEWKEEEVPELDNESVSEFLWWQHGLDDSEFSEATRQVLQAAEKADIW
jgi:hypothetical protein